MAGGGSLWASRCSSRTGARSSVFGSKQMGHICHVSKLSRAAKTACPIPAPLEGWLGIVNPNPGRPALVLGARGARPSHDRPMRGQAAPQGRRSKHARSFVETQRGRRFALASVPLFLPPFQGSTLCDLYPGPRISIRGSAVELQASLRVFLPTVRVQVALHRFASPPREKTEPRPREETPGA